MSLFGELDVASAADDPFEVPPNVYNAVVTDVFIRPTKDDTKIGMTIVFTIDDNSEHKGKQVREWKHLPTPVGSLLSSEDKKSLSFIKSRMMDLGIPEDRINSAGPEDIIGKEVTITVIKKGDFANISKVTLLQNAVTAGGKKFK